MLSNCMMSKIRAITKIYRCAKLTDILNTWQKRFIMIIIMLRSFEIFTSCQGLMQTFSKHYFKCKMVSIKFRKTLQESRLSILKFSRVTFLTSKNIFMTYNIPGISLEHFWNKHLWNVPRIFRKHYFVITGICREVSICYYQIIHF